MAACYFGCDRSHAGLITFESHEGFAEGDVVTTVLTPDNAVSFSVPGSPNAWVHKVGGRRTAFVRGDTPAGGRPGMLFLSDEPAVIDRLGNVGEYFLSFERPISSLSVDTYDYRADGGGAVGDMVTLELFSSEDLLTSLVGSDSFTVPDGEIDGITKTLSVDLLSGTSALFARILHSGRDVGTGIDNVRFDTVMPEPASVVVWSLFGLALMLTRRRWNLRR